MADNKRKNGKAPDDDADIGDLNASDDDDFGDLDTPLTAADDADDGKMPAFPRGKELDDADIEYEVIDDEPEPDAEDGDEAEYEAEEEEAEEEAEPVAADTAEIDAERKARLKAEQENQELRQRLDQADQRDRDSNKRALAMAETHVDGEIKSITAELKQAVEDGDTAKQVDLHEKLATAAARRQKILDYKQQAEREPAPKRETPVQDAEPQQAQPFKNPKTEAWVKRNPWFRKQTHPCRLYAIGIDNQLVEEGYDPSTDDYFREMDKRLAPVLKANGVRAPKAPARRGQRPKAEGQPLSPVAPVTPRPSRKSGKVTIGPAERENMVRFGLDPSNKAHLAEYARNMRAGANERRTG